MKKVQLTITGLMKSLCENSKVNTLGNFLVISNNMKCELVAGHGMLRFVL